MVQRWFKGGSNTIAPCFSSEICRWHKIISSSGL